MIENAADPGEHSVAIPAVLVLNRDGGSPFLLVCDHASNRIPEEYADLGLSAVERLAHIAWDPGALAVALRLSDRLDATLIQTTYSRLVIDPNRGADRPDLIAEVSETTQILANEHVSAADRASRIARFHAPYHEAIASEIERRRGAGRETVLVAIHSFTPVYRGVARPWAVGLLPGQDEGYTRALADALRAEAPELAIGWNEPYASFEGVTYTIERHGVGLDCTMIEIRNDQILEPAGVALWTERLARALPAAREMLGARS